MEPLWNCVVWEAIADIKHSCCIDSIFSACERELNLLGAPEREIELRVFALALYCQKSYPMEFFKSIAFTRFGDALNFLFFEKIAKRLIEDSSFAVVVYWAVLRCSLAGSIPQKAYFDLEKEMRAKSLELGNRKK
ncbi:MAG: hypothetical protein LBH25_07895 [Fibromonadaceae bacterium]|jgi:hypothetical protein|nr:hypothetical protein [Fibromonadaceae bacterium]